jgi:hypothetical protein
MGVLPKQWIKWVAVLLGVAGESRESASAPEIFTSSEDGLHTMSSLLRDTNQETLAVVHGNFVMSEGAMAFARESVSRLRVEKQMHGYVIIVARIADLSEESFQRCFAIERDPSLEGRLHYRVIDSAVSFGCNVFDQKHWELDFPPNPAEPKGAAILFRNHPEGARLIASFIHHQWLEKPGVTMSLSDAYEKWKAIQASAAFAGIEAGTKDRGQSEQSRRRNRIIAMAAGAIIVTAIVVAFAAWQLPGGMITKKSLMASADFLLGRSSLRRETQNSVNGANLVGLTQTPMSKMVTSLSFRFDHPGRPGQLLIADVMTYQGKVPVIEAPARWKLIRDDSSASTRQSLYAYVGEPSEQPVTWKFNQPVEAQGVILILDGAAASDPIGESSAGASSDDLGPAPAVITADDGDFIMVFFATDFGEPGLSPRLPDDMIEIVKESGSHAYWILGSYQTKRGKTAAVDCPSGQLYNAVAAQVAIKRRYAPARR